MSSSTILFLMGGSMERRWIFFLLEEAMVESLISDILFGHDLPDQNHKARVKNHAHISFKCNEQPPFGAAFSVTENLNYRND